MESKKGLGLGWIIDVFLISIKLPCKYHEDLGVWGVSIVIEQSWCMEEDYFVLFEIIPWI